MRSDVVNGGANGRADQGGGWANVGSGPAPAPERLTLRDYINVVWRRKWIVVLVVVVAAASAFFFSNRQPRQYVASADLIYESQLNISNPLTGQGYVDPSERLVQLNSVGSVIASPDMQQRAVGELRTQGESVVGFSVTSAPLADTSSGATANVVRITATSGQPKLAAAAANAYAVTFVAYRKETVKSQIQRAIDAINGRLATYHGAAQQSTDYLVLQQRLADLQLLRSTASGNFRVLVPATVPTSPVSPKPFRSAILGFAVGLFAAIGLAFLLEQFDTRVRKPEEIAAILRQPVLGRIPRISQKVLAEGAVTTLRQPDGHAAEAFRLVRTNLEFLSVDQAVHSVLLTSCVQGEGKSSAVANLAVTLTMSGKKVVIVDADLRRPRQHAYFGLRNEKGISTVASGQHELVDALMPVDVSGLAVGRTLPSFSAWAEASDARSTLFVLPSGPIPPNPGEIVASERLSSIIEQLEADADLVLVDTPAMLPIGDTSAIAPKVDGLIFLADMHVIKKPQLEAAAEQLMRLPVRMLGIIVRGAHTGGRYGYRSGYSYTYSYSDNGDRRRLGRRRTGSAVDEAAARAPVVAVSDDVHAGDAGELQSSLLPSVESEG